MRIGVLEASLYQYKDGSDGLPINDKPKPWNGSTHFIHLKGKLFLKKPSIAQCGCAENQFSHMTRNSDKVSLDVDVETRKW